MGDIQLEHMADFGGLVLIAGTFVGWLPVIATVLAVLWYGIEIWESETGHTLRNWLKRRKHDDETE